jgi:spore maturation protein SpmA
MRAAQRAAAVPGATAQGQHLLDNAIWVAFILIGFVVACSRLAQGDVAIFTKVLTGLFDTAKTGFDISLGLVGVMSLWLGIMKVGEQAGMINLFAGHEPAVPAAVPRDPGRPPGRRQHRDELQRQHAGAGQRRHAAGPEGHARAAGDQPVKDVASNPMIMFLVLNTAGITLIPTSVIAIRQSAGGRAGAGRVQRADIFLPTLIGTFISFVAGLVAVAWVQRIRCCSGR